MNVEQPLGPWGGAPLATSEYTLSPARPLRVAHKHYTEPTSEAYDMHYAFELGIVLQGRMKRLYRQHSRLLEPGQLWLCAPWEPHGWCVSEGPCEALVVNIFPPTLASPAIPELAGLWLQTPFMVEARRRPQVPTSRHGHVRKLARELSRTLATAGPREFLRQRLLLYQVLLELPPLQADAALDPPQGAWECVSRAIDLVMKRRSFVSARQAARECALSERSFNACFARAVGLSFAKFALCYRLQAAASQLLGTNDPVKAVGQDWGFADASHFHAAFRASYGCSPVRYRLRHGQLSQPMSSDSNTSANQSVPSRHSQTRLAP